MTTRCMVNANMDSRGSGKSILHNKTWPPSDSLLITREWCLELSNWVSVYKMFAFTTQHEVIELPERTSDCPEPKAFSKVLYLCLDFYVSTTMLNFSYKVYK